MDGVTLSNLRTIKEALESMKIDYFHFLSNRHHAIKFAEETLDAYQEKENEVDRPCLDLRLAQYSLYQAELLHGNCSIPLAKELGTLVTLQKDHLIRNV